MRLYLTISYMAADDGWASAGRTTVFAVPAAAASWILINRPHGAQKLLAELADVRSADENPLATAL